MILCNKIISVKKGKKIEKTLSKSKKKKAVTREKSETKTNLKKSSRNCIKRDAGELEMMKDLQQRMIAKERK